MTKVTKTYIIIELFAEIVIRTYLFFSMAQKKVSQNERSNGARLIYLFIYLFIRKQKNFLNNINTAFKLKYH